ncbi:MAG TPA: EF-P beta-lysylation protein EpmB [Pirellulales bacterium]|nr:EF-P beta-lysylation protein EpmB [Pirellulales bacterium]
MIIPDLTPPVGADFQKSPPSWQLALKAAIRDPVELCGLLQLPADLVPAAKRAARGFPLFAPRGYVDRMRPGDPRDPLLLQVLPLDEELSDTADFVPDPVGDGRAEVTPGLLHKYYGRVLLVTTGACAIHCRYCFRRHFPYGEMPHSLAAWQSALEQIAADPTIEEIILSGGDPLTLVDSLLGRLVERLEAISHVRRLRIHTRLPIVVPERVCQDLFDWLRGTRLTPIVVVHANHPAEISPSVANALARLIDARICVLNQSVLLKRINDNADVLADLCRRLVELHVMPYYLHQLDRVQGAAHFEVAADVGMALVTELRRRLPGYAVPRYVREVAGAPFKEPVMPEWADWKT